MCSCSTVSRNGIVALFSKLIGMHNLRSLETSLITHKWPPGEVRKCEQKKSENGTSYFELCFHSYDDAKYAANVFIFISFRNFALFRKALCMTGYNVSGTPLWVHIRQFGLHIFWLERLPFSSVTPCLSEHSNRYDTRRNLYVLGLPSELNKFVTHNLNYSINLNAMI